MEILGMLAWMWLIVGFLCGVKTVYIENAFTKEVLQKLYDQAKTPQDRNMVVMFSKKSNALIGFTLLGFFVLYLEIQSTIRDVKKGINSFKSRDKRKR